MARRELLQDDIKIDFTSLIDVVFLLLVFFMLIPLKEMEAKFEAEVSKKEDPSPVFNEVELPKVVYYIDLKSETVGDDVITRIMFNQEALAAMRSPSLTFLDRVEKEGSGRWNAFVREQKIKDKKQADPNLSPGLQVLRESISKAVRSSPEGLHTPVIIRSGPGVPFKWVMAAFNTGVAAELKKLSFGAPSNEIWREKIL